MHLTEHIQMWALAAPGQRQGLVDFRGLLWSQAGTNMNRVKIFELGQAFYAAFSGALLHGLCKEWSSRVLMIVALWSVVTTGMTTSDNYTCKTCSLLLVLLKARRTELRSTSNVRKLLPKWNLENRCFMKLHSFLEDLVYFVTSSFRKTLASIYPSNCTNTIHSLTHPSIIFYPLIYLIIHLTCPSTYLSIHPSFNILFIHVSVHSSTCRSTCQSVHPSFYPSVSPSVHPPFIYLSIHLSVYPLSITCQFIIYPYIH